jgi:hypothetical protein
MRGTLSNLLLYLKTLSRHAASGFPQTRRLEISVLRQL